MKEKQSYTADFRESAVKLVLKNDQPIAATARELGVNENTLHTWISKYSQPKADGSGHSDEHLYDELKRLKKRKRAFERGTRPVKKGGRVLCQGTSVKYAWIQQHQSGYGVRPLCRFMAVSSSGYYAWSKQCTTARYQEDQQLTERLHVFFEQGRGTYGTRRLKHLFANEGVRISRRRIGRLMVQTGLCCRTKRKFKVTTDSKHHNPIAPNHLNRAFIVEQPDRCYVGDITSIWTQQGWLYLAVVIDLFSRQRVGWSIQSHMRTSLVDDTLLMAIWRRKPKAGLLWHTDRGCQYASNHHRRLLKQHHIIQSMSRKGNCWDTQFTMLENTTLI